jgi:hypothetical protein
MALTNRNPSSPSSPTEEEVPLLSSSSFFLSEIVKSSLYSIFMILELHGFLRLGGAILFMFSLTEMNRNGFIFVSL